MAYLLALDQGTSSSRSIVFDAGGRIVAMAQREFRQIYPQPGWVEHDAEEIYAACQAVLREAVEALRDAVRIGLVAGADGPAKQAVFSLVDDTRTPAVTTLSPACTPSVTIW